MTSVPVIFRRRTFVPVFLVAAVLGVLAGAEAFAFTVVIDAGHGAHDPGASSGSYLEKHLALDTARRLERFLKKRKIKTRMTRKGDRYLPLSGRVAAANGTRDAIFVSVHYNWSRNRSAKGIETYYGTGRSRLLAGFVHNHIVHKVRPVNRGVKRRQFYVVKHCRHPAVLVECGFLSNRTERRRCLDPKYRQLVAEGIGNAILRYKKRR